MSSEYLRQGDCKNFSVHLFLTLEKLELKTHKAKSKKNADHLDDTYPNIEPKV